MWWNKNVIMTAALNGIQYKFLNPRLKILHMHVATSHNIGAFNYLMGSVLINRKNSLYIFLI